MTVHLLRKIYTILRKIAIFRERISEIPQKVSQNVLPYTLYKHSLRLFKKSKGCNTACNKMTNKCPLSKSVGMPKFKVIKRTYMFDKVILFAIQQISTNIWR